LLKRGQPRVRNQQIERLLAELLNEPFDELIPPTLAGNIGYLSPADRYVPFLFTEDIAIEVVAAGLSIAVKRAVFRLSEKFRIRRFA
jgi:hypothetical protein